MILEMGAQTQGVHITYPIFLFDPKKRNVETYFSKTLPISSLHENLFGGSVVV